VAYDPANRTVQLTLPEPAQVVIEAWWATSFTPPEPASTSLRVIDSRLEPGQHVIPLPAEVPPVASFVTVSAGPAVRAFTVGAMPEAVLRMVPAGDPAQPPALPPVRAVATHSDDGLKAALDGRTGEDPVPLPGGPPAGAATRPQLRHQDR